MPASKNLVEFLDLSDVEAFAKCFAECQTETEFDINALYERPYEVPSESLVHMAVKLQNVEIVKLLLSAKSMNVNSVTTEFQATSLHYAVKLPSLEIVQLLLDGGANPILGNLDATTPLSSAIYGKFVPNILLILQQPLVLDNIAKDVTSGKYLEHAIKANLPVETLEALITAGCNVDGEKPSVDHVDTPLHTALQNNNIPLAQLLIQRGASVIKVGNNYRTALHLAVIFCDDVNIVKLILNHGADPDCMVQNGDTALNLATQIVTINTDICDALLDGGCNVNGNVRPYYDSPLLSAVLNKNLDLAKLLVVRGANMIDTGHHGRPLLFDAVEFSNIAIVELLIESNPILINAEDSYGKTALHYAVARQCLDIVQLLLAKGASPDCGKYKFTPFRCAVDGNTSTEIAEALLLAGCDIDGRMSDEDIEKSPLQQAVDLKKFEFVSLFIRYGLQSPNDNLVKENALFAAVQTKNTKLVEYVTQSTTTIVNWNFGGFEALEYATTSDDTVEIVELILDFRAARIIIKPPREHQFVPSEILMTAIQMNRLKIVQCLFSIHSRDKRLFDMTANHPKLPITLYEFFKKQKDPKILKILVLFISVCGNVNFKGGFIPYSDLVHQTEFKTLLFTPEICYQYDVLCHGCYFLWFLLVQERFVNKLVSDIIAAHPELATAKDDSGRSAIDAATPSNKLIINSLLLWHGKYRVTESKPEHTSATCFVFKAVDESRTDETGSYIPVALKLMRVKVQFEREVGCRAENFDSTFVVDLVTQYLPKPNTLLLENGDVEMPVISGALTKTQAESMYCVVMPLADRNMFVALKQERFTAQAELTEVKHIFTQLVQCVAHMHTKGMLHGDLKTLNIVRTGIQWKLIDLDASCRIGVDAVGAKSSSAYVAPECIHANRLSGVAYVKSASVSAEFNLIPLIAEPSFDVWSLGCLLYQMCSNGKTLFQASTDDNLSGEAKDMQKEDSLWGLAEWPAELKAKKLSEISNPFAANLLSLLLEKDPLKRPTLSHVLLHPFLTGKKGTRLVGEVPAFDVFISYRVASDAHHAEILYDLLTLRGLKVWLDKKCLQMGVDWEQGFCAGLMGSGAFICLLSEGAVSHQTIPWQNFSQLTVESRCDNVLLEHRLALELREIGLITKIYPILIGEVGVDGLYSRFNAWPSGQHTHVTSVEAGLIKHMNNEGLGTPLHPNKTVAAVCTEIGKCNGSFIVGELTASFGAAVDSIVSMLQVADENVNIPHSPGKMSARLRDSVKADQVEVLENEVIRLEHLHVASEQKITLFEQRMELMQIESDKKLRDSDEKVALLLKENERLTSLTKV